MKERLLRRADVLLIVVLAALCAVLLLVQRFSPQATRADIYVDGALYTTIDLHEAMPAQELTLATEPQVTINAAGGSISFTHAACPDQLCVAYGRLAKAGQTAVCLPAGVVICVRGQAAGWDAITY